MARKKIKKYRVGLNSQTKAISLVSEPAIEIDFIHMSKDEEELKQVYLEKDDKYLVYGPVLLPDKDIYRNNGTREYYLSFSKESIEKMSQDYMKDFKQYNVSLQHQNAVDEVCVVESWLVADSYKDKANALGFNVPEGTWMVAMKVNNVDTWNRIKDGELKGFSVESLVSLEEYNNDMEEDNMLFSKVKEWVKELLGKADNDVDTETSEAGKITPNEEIKLEEETPAVETPQEQPKETVEPPKVEDPTTTPPATEETPTEAENKPNDTTKVEEPKDNHLEELINNLKEEIEALKGLNKDLNKKVKDLEKEPSVNPIKPNQGNGNKGDSYDRWRQAVKQMIG